MLIIVELAHAGSRVRSIAPRLVANGQPCEHVPTIGLGWPESPKDAFRYTCPTQDAQLQLVIESRAFTLTSGCQT